MATIKENDEFRDLIIHGFPLDEAIDYIEANLNPEDVFNEDKLKEWAIDNGYEEC